MSAFKTYLKCPPTRIGLIFALLVPMLFTLVWMTGYRGADTRIDRIHAAFVNESGAEGEAALTQMMSAAPFQSHEAESLGDARDRMGDGEWDMVVMIPDTFSEGRGEIVFEITEDASDVVKSMLEGAARQLTDGLSANVETNAVQAKLVRTYAAGDFSESILPMLLGFIPYIAMMTANIQFNLSSNILKRALPRWSLFWSRQALLVVVAVVLSVLLTAVTRLFVDPASSFGAMFGFQLMLVVACLATTQMAFALFGPVGPLFNVALVPFQLMTAGNIISSEMLTPFYRQIGSFLPASNGIEGFMHLIYGGRSAGAEALHLALIAIVAWGLTLGKQFIEKKPQAVAGGMPQRAGAAH
jgi:hypothetical protein